MGVKLAKRRPDGVKRGDPEREGAVCVSPPPPSHPWRRVRDAARGPSATRSPGATRGQGTTGGFGAHLPRLSACDPLEAIKRLLHCR